MAGEIRLNKYISDTGFCSRREADQLIADERVTVNGLCARMGMKVSLTDKVRIDGETLKYHSVREELALAREAKKKQNRRPKPEDTASVFRPVAARQRRGAWKIGLSNGKSAQTPRPDKTKTNDKRK